MGKRKKISADLRKEAVKSLAFAKLNDCPSSPRKMRLVADQVRNKSVEKALQILKTSPKAAARKVHKLLLSAMSNWQLKNVGTRIEDSNLYVKEIFVDCGKMLKRVQPAPQGRAYRVRKRSNHVTLTIGSLKQENEMLEQETAKEEKEITQEINNQVKE